MTNAEALILDADLQDLPKLKANRFFLRHILPEVTRLRDEHRSGMRDLTKSQGERCEHVTAWEALQLILDFPETEEARLRALLHEHDAAAHTIDRPFSSRPN